MLGRLGKPMEALVEGIDQGLLVLRLRKGGLVHIKPQKGLNVGGRAVLIYEPFTAQITGVFTMAEWESHQEAIPEPGGIEPEEDSPTEDFLDDCGDDNPDILPTEMLFDDEPW